MSQITSRLRHRGSGRDLLSLTDELCLSLSGLTNFATPGFLLPKMTDSQGEPRAVIFRMSVRERYTFLRRLADCSQVDMLGVLYKPVIFGALAVPSRQGRRGAAAASPPSSATAPCHSEPFLTTILILKRSVLADAGMTIPSTTCWVCC